MIASLTCLATQNTVSDLAGHVSPRPTMGGLGQPLINPNKSAICLNLTLFLGIIADVFLRKRASAVASNS